MAKPDALHVFIGRVSVSEMNHSGRALVVGRAVFGAKRGNFRLGKATARFAHATFLKWFIDRRLATNSGDLQGSGVGKSGRE